MTFPDLALEIDLWQRGFTVIGVDEVGRGAFAGPVFVGGVIFKPTTDKIALSKLLSYGINDSKVVAKNKRKLLAKIIQSECLAHYISSIDVAKINRIGIGKATFCAMREVIKNLCKNSNLAKPYVLVDGFYIKNLAGITLKNQQRIIHGDAISLSIAAASIIAKVARDEHMVKLSAKIPDYYWKRNKGYGTKQHQEAIKKFGPNALHRRAFIKNLINTQPY